MTPSIAEGLAGKLNFAATVAFGRVGRNYIRKLYARPSPSNIG